MGVPLIWLIKLRGLRDRFARFKVAAIVREDGTVQGDEGATSRANSSGKAMIDIEDPVLSVSPLQSLFRGIKPHYASYYEVVDMIRRLALTCGTMVAGNGGSLAGFVLFSLSVAMISLLGHTQLLPFDTELMDNMNR